MDTAAQHFQHSFDEQVMIHAQKPTAEMVLAYDQWKAEYGRFVRRGSRGIILYREAGNKVQVRYMFDLRDTAGQPVPPEVLSAPALFPPAKI